MAVKIGLVSPLVSMPSAHSSCNDERLTAGQDAEPTWSPVDIVSLPHFIQSTRASGYISPASALAELIDNAIEAEATRIRVTLETDSGTGEVSCVTVEDNGLGMGPRALSHALCFGGSSRYNSRKGLGRFGMGLPNSSFSQARRVEVSSRVRGGDDWTSSLDLDEIVLEGRRAIPFPRRGLDFHPLGGSESGTRVRWKRCDRLATRSLRQLKAEVIQHFEQTFRYFLWDGLFLEVNGERLRGSDPLKLEPRAPHAEARAFGEPLVFPVSMELAGHGPLQGEIRVRFSELPILRWGGLSNAEKRRLGVVRGAGVSVVRSGREVDFGWFFMGEKRKEAYDDWWRCELCYDASLDELFGLTHTKQQIRPLPVLEEILTPHMERAARALNARVRRAQLAVKSRQRVSRSEQRLSRIDARLPPLPALTGAPVALLTQLESAAPGLLERATLTDSPVLLLETELPGHPLFEWARQGEKLLVVMNTLHPLYTQVYQPLLERTGDDAARQRELLELWLLALARAEASDTGGLRAYRERWSDVLAELLKVTI